MSTIFRRCCPGDHRRDLSGTNGYRPRFQLLVNALATTHEGEMVFRTLQRTTQQSLDIEIYPLGWIPHDIHVQKAVSQ